MTPRRKGRQDRVLLLWRHRLIPDSREWELPSGVAEPDENLEAAAARPALRESGWEPARLRPLIRLEASAGLTDSVSHLFWTDEARYRGEPEADFEADRIEWVPLDQAPARIAGGQVCAASTVAALLLLPQARADGQ